jgi:hypothetical protein
MKSMFLSLAVSLFFLSESLAIPQTFATGNNGFFGAVGVQFEQFAASRDTWQPGAELKGTWRAAGGNASKVKGVETLDLGLDAAVFGIPAAQISVERAGGVVTRFVVRFKEGKMKNGGKANTGGLFSQVTANLTALAGEPKSVSPGGEKTFRYESSMITARRSGAKEVVVEFTPAR